MPLDVDRLVTRLNPLVAWLLRSPLHRLASGGLLLLGVTGRRTGRRYAIPVGYQQDGDVLTILVSHARRKQWWRNLHGAAPVDVRLRGRARRGTARVVPPDSAAFRAAVDATLRRLPALGGQFGVAYDRRTGLDDSQWRTIAADVAVVRIDLEPEA